MSLAVVIPSRNAANLEKCVEAKLAMEPGQPIRLIVVDDGLRSIPQCCKGGTVIGGIRPFVFARNCNLGIKEALRDPNCDGVILLNDDALLRSPGGFSLLARAAAQNPEYGVIGAVTNVTGQPLQFRRDIGLRQVPHIAYVCVYIPRTTLERVGLLDERYAIDYGCDDRDHCEAVNRAGLKVGVHDGAFVDHGSLVSTFRGDPATPKSFDRNYALFKQKWGIA